MQHSRTFYYYVNSDGKISISTTSQGLRDQVDLQIRVENAEFNLQIVTTYLKCAFGNHLKVNILRQFALNLCERYLITIDRLALRNKKALLCWYAENWHIIKINRSRYHYTNNYIRWEPF